MAEKVLGKITHFYGKIGVAVVDVTGKIEAGQTVKIKRKGGEEFEQVVESMQVEHKDVDLANKGDQVGMKIDQAAKPGDIILEV